MDKCEIPKLSNQETIILNNLIITKSSTPSYTAYILQVQNKEYELNHIKLMSKFDIDAILMKLHTKIYQQDHRVIVISLVYDSDSLNVYHKMINYGVIKNTQFSAAKNIFKNVDIITIEYKKYEDRRFVFKFIKRMLQCQKMAAVLHGATIKFNEIPKKQPSNQKQAKAQTYSIITGGSRGIGAKIAIQLAKTGKNLIITGRPDNKHIEQFTKQLQQQYKVKVIHLPLQINDLKSCQQFVKKLSQLNDLTIQNIIFNAGVGQKTSQQQVTPQKTKQQILIQVNAFCPLKLYEQLFRYKIMNNNTLIMIVSSVFAYRPYKQMNPSYACAKYMLQAWIQTIRKQYNTMIIYPGATDTDMFAKSTLNRMKQIGKLQEFVGKLPKKMVIDPSITGKIVELFICDEFREYFRDSKILASCGGHLDFSAWPTV